MMRHWWAMGTAAALVLGSGLASANDSMKEKEKKIETETHKQAGKAERQLSELRSDEVKKIQSKLAADGFYDGKIDGHAGAKTMASLSKFASAKGIEFRDGILNSKLFTELEMKRRDIEPVKGTSKEKEKAKPKGSTTDTSGKMTSPTPAEKKTQSGRDRSEFNGSTGPATGGDSVMGHDMDSTPDTDVHRQSGTDHPIPSNTPESEVTPAPAMTPLAPMEGAKPPY